ncbi:MAG: hypothetical protein ACK4N5_02870 [Myxococcales bacterium]
MIRTAIFSAVLALHASALAGPLSAQQIERREGVVRLAAGLDTPPVRGAPEDVARTFALQHRAELGLEGQELEVNRVLKTKLGTVVRLQPTVNGLPLVGIEVTVALTDDNRVRRVMSDARPVVGLQMEQLLTGQQALNRAAAGVPMVRHEGGNAVGSFREVAWYENGVARRAYEVHLVTLDLTRNLYAIVDAQSGEVKTLTNRVYHADQAKVFASNPGKDGNLPLQTVDLKGFPATRDPNGYLVGELFDSFNCCPTENCEAGKPPKKVTTNAGGFNVETVLCDMQHTASNVQDRTTGAPRTNYDYSNSSPRQYDPPSGQAGTHAADSDPFSEVHVHHHAHRAYEFFRTYGDSSFVLRDGRRTPPAKPQVWANFLMPDYNSAQFGNPVVINRFARVDNAAFIPRESWQQLGLSQGTAPDSDALVMFQGTEADFGYDGDVVYHELTHGVIYTTANFQGIALDQHGALNEGGAMHEGFADYFSAAITNDPKVGEYVGTRVPTNPNAPPAEGALRDLENDFKCPDLLVGEVHVDSEHFSAALWASRKKLGGTTAASKFDEAVIDAMFSLSPQATFRDAATAVANAAATAL